MLPQAGHVNTSEVVVENQCINTEATFTEHSLPLDGGCCPFYQAAHKHCKISQLSVSQERRVFCRSDEYDGCPTYLGYILRRTNPLRGDHDWLDAEG